MLNFLFSLTDYTDYSLLALRCAIAVVFVYHGAKKIKNAKGPFFTLGLLETMGAIAMFGGFLTQLVAMGFGAIMLGAIYFKKYKWQLPFMSETNTGYEFDFILLAANLSLIFSGPGAFSLDLILFNL